ncbi:c-type cytochrome [Nannocystis bainbridge]|uniref:Cytochrome c n=1 Tax=Nannocystis bainbridge TaxID=2995303 RepID=A0ABT5E6N4_9BACT|nr:cytochrome c [Nannocystis bainbridge]MDC0721522.1 cytochrome c [Nannocystis bainbridge]
MSRASAALLLLAALGCRQQMREQARLDPYEEAPFFADDMEARRLPDGVVPRGQARLDRHLWQGRAADGSLVTVYPFAITRADLVRGEQRYAIHCTPCHGRLGEGDGLAVRRGYPAPIAFTAARLRDAPVGHIFEVISQGRATMPDYDHLEIHDRWRIVAWVQVLQLSQHAPAAVLGADDRTHLVEALP